MLTKVVRKHIFKKRGDCSVHRVEDGACETHYVSDKERDQREVLEVNQRVLNPSIRKQTFFGDEHMESEISCKVTRSYSKVKLNSGRSEHPKSKLIERFV